MKHIAVLIFGQLREFEIAIKSWQFLKLPINFDIFMSTWNTTYSLREDGSYSETESVTIEKIENIIGPLTNYYIATEIIDTAGSMKNMLHHIKNCIRMMIAQDKLYDAVVIIRPDVWLDDRIDFGELLLNPCIDNTVYTYGDLHKTDNGENVIMDNLFICNEDTSLKFLVCPTDDYDIHRLFGQFFVDNNLIAQSFKEPFEIFIVRENCRNIPNITQDIVRKKYYDWLVAHNRR